MKNILTYFLLLVLVFSCNKNDFYDTEMYFETNKETYRVNDSFEITVVIAPKNEKKKIRILKSLGNLKISFHSKNEELGFSQELKKTFIEGPSLFGDDSEYINEYTISKTKPFKRSFKGTISVKKEKVVFEIAELGIKDSFEKSALLKAPIIVIKGNCSTVYSGIEENFKSKEIKILID